MKIAILHSGDLDKISPGGISQYVEKIIKANNNKNEIYVYGTIDYNSNFKLFKRYKKSVGNAYCEFIPISNNSKRPLSIYYFISLLRNKKLFKDTDIIYAQRMEYVLPFIFSKQKIVFAVHGSGKYAEKFWGKRIAFFYEILEKVAIKISDKVIVLLKRMEYGLPYYQNKFRKQSYKFVYGKVPIDTSIFNQLSDKVSVRKKYGYLKDDNIIIYFGRLEDNPKRILMFPEIANLLVDKISNLKWIIIGDGDDKIKLQNKIKEYKLDKVFHFKGHVKHGKELNELINCSNISIIASSFEGICMSALESIACGVPVIATDVGDVNEYITSDNNGIIVPNVESDLVKNIEGALESFFRNKHQIHINDIYKNYESNSVINELQELFNNLV